jgi:VanZ family protein
MKHMHIKRFIITLFIIGMVFFIWYNSLQDARHSTAESRYVLSLLLHYARSAYITLHLHLAMLRKLAHLTEFALLGMGLRIFTLLLSGPPKKKWVLLVGVSVAAIDEGLQLFSPGRSAELRDVALDTLGVFLGMLVIICIERMISFFKRWI